MEESKKREAFMLRLKERGLTQEKLARTLGKSLTTVHSWAVGRHTPTLSPNEMVRLCSALGCSLAELAEMFPEETESA
jgi:DNA-binding transcriptional regulator YiaG